MFLLPGRARATISASDLRQAAACEWGLLVGFDAVLGRGPGMPAEQDALYDRTLALGLAHEQTVLRELMRERRVVEIPRPRLTAEGLDAAATATREALAGPADVVYQAAFADGRFMGFADFLVRLPDGRWQVWDTKLARSASVPALLQLAAYADHLAALGVPVAPEAVLALGSGERESYPLDVITPVFRGRRDRVLALLDGHQDLGSPAEWGTPDVHACGRCAACSTQLQAREDVLLVAGVYTSQRKHLLAAGVTTMSELAVRTEPVPDLPSARLERLRAQARLQLRQAATGTVHAEVTDAAALAALPPPSPGDIFFDFEGDPMWSEPGSARSGLEYLFGVVEAPAKPGGPAPFRAFWAHDRAQERQALIDFLAYVTRRREQHPDLHIYHYADYERSRLLTLAARYGVCEAEVDQLLRDGVLVDLYAVVRAGIRVSQDSYSIKKLEPLYMGDELREGPVATGGDSIVAYHEYVQAGIEGRLDEAATLLESIRSYNEYDCLSTLRLRDWLLDRARSAGAALREPVVIDSTEEAPETGATADAPPPKAGAWERAEALELRLRELLGDVPAHRRTAEQQALALVAASLQYNRREQKPYWWRHFDRLRHPVDDWSGQPDVFHVRTADLVADWATAPGSRLPQRTLRLRGEFGRGSRPVRAGDELVIVYDVPPPEGLGPTAPGLRVASTRLTVTEIAEGAGGPHGSDGSDEGGMRLIGTERLPGRFRPFTELPLALTPGAPPPTTNIDRALADIAESVAESWPDLPATPGLDLLRRRPPRLTGGGGLPVPDDSPDRFVHAITAAIVDVDNSYLAVQGPPGTGKTHVAAHVIADLVRERGWRVGIVAQSHAAVENVLDALVRAGLDADLIGKHAPGRPDAAWHHLANRDKDLPAFAAARAESGYVLGGTAYDFTHPKRLERGQLDLLVVDEAGQFSLANTLACSLAAQRLLLLGDPQQLPEVSQGVHPEPVDTSALGWLMAGADTIDPALGYFLASTWRMHPLLTERISRLSYAGSLTAQESVTAGRSLAGVAPGVHVRPVTHRDNTIESIEEAQAVAADIAGLLGREWLDPSETGGSRPLQQSDIRVVTPYNAQVHRLRSVLDEAGLEQVAAGTVDKFQGQEAAVVFVSMAASARSDVSRGMAFLLDRNRLNVALSRAKWAAFVVCSPELTDFTPRSPRELLLLGAFLQLTADQPLAPVADSPDPSPGAPTQLALW